MSIPQPEASQISAVEEQSQSWQVEDGEIDVLDEATAIADDEAEDDGDGIEGEGDADVEGGGGGEGEEAKAPNKKRERRENVPLEREEGKSLLPFTRVQKIIKADRVRSLSYSH
jgi:hypothetical protein